MLKIMIAVPTFENIEPETFGSIYDLNVPDNVVTDFRYTRGYDCARARNAIVKAGINEEFDYILMIDSDIIVPKETLQFALENEPDIILGVYPRKNDPDKSEIFNNGYDDFKPSARWSIQELKNFPSNRIRIKGGGFGCALVKTSVYKDIGYPYFNYVNYDDGTFLSEDLYLCTQATKHNYPIYVDTRILCKHIRRDIVG